MDEKIILKKEVVNKELFIKEVKEYLRSGLCPFSPFSEGFKQKIERCCIFIRMGSECPHEDCNAFFVRCLNLKPYVRLYLVRNCIELIDSIMDYNNFNISNLFRVFYSVINLSFSVSTLKKFKFSKIKSKKVFLYFLKMYVSNSYCKLYRICPYYQNEKIEGLCLDCDPFFMLKNTRIRALIVNMYDLFSKIGALFDFMYFIPILSSKCRADLELERKQLLKKFKLHKIKTRVENILRIMDNKK